MHLPNELRYFNDTDQLLIIRSTWHRGHWVRAQGQGSDSAMYSGYQLSHHPLAKRAKVHQWPKMPYGTFQLSQNATDMLQTYATYVNA